MELRQGRATWQRERETSPDMAKMPAMRAMHPKVKPTRKVQAVYYLSRNGQLEHPHFMEITHFADQPLRLKDFTDRLTVLRGKGMPALYSWSCKRGYKNGYVWNDLADGDVIHPSHGGEYVLKGSELLERPSNPGKVQHLNHAQHHFVADEEDDEEQEVLELEDEEKTSYTSSTTTASHCSRGVSTEEPHESDTRKFDSDTSDKPCRSSVLLQLISCGNMTVNKVKALPASGAGVGGNGVLSRKSNVCDRDLILRKGCRRSEEEEDMIRYMSENPRFARLQSEDKEYFSGSIVDAMTSDAREPSRLKKSNSYGEDRSSKPEALDAKEEDDDGSDRPAVTNKCIPRKISSLTSKQHRR